MAIREGFILLLLSLWYSMLQLGEPENKQDIPKARTFVGRCLPLSLTSLLPQVHLSEAGEPSLWGGSEAAVAKISPASFHFPSLWGSQPLWVEILFAPSFCLLEWIHLLKNRLRVLQEQDYSFGMSQGSLIWASTLKHHSQSCPELLLLCTHFSTSIFPFVRFITQPLSLPVTIFEPWCQPNQTFSIRFHAKYTAWEAPQVFSELWWTPNAQSISFISAFLIVNVMAF